MPISNYYPFSMIHFADDDGVYYMRQLERTSDFPFEGMVWYGQKSQNEPDWAHVFIGRLIKNAGTDASGNSIDQWEGFFFDVPKGRNCGHGLLNLESIVLTKDEVAACDTAPAYFIRKINGPLFGGSFWRIELAVRDCILIEIPPTPPILQAIKNADRAAGRIFSIMDEVRALGSANVNNGFTTTEVNNLTGTYQCDDGGKYYIRHILSTNEVVWYGESPDARTSSIDRLSSGFANVFWGRKRGRTIRGLWADVPRGAALGRGQMTLQNISPNVLRISSVSGGFGGRMLRKIVSLNVTMTARTLTIVNSNEGADEPLIYLIFYKIDGESIDFDRLNAGRGIFQTPPSILVGDNLRSDREHAVDASNNRFRTSLQLMPSVTVDTRAQTKIGVIGFAHEVDEGYSNEFRRNRFFAWRDSQVEFINNQLSGGIIPTNEAIRTNSQRILVQYLGPWSGWPWGDTDDVFSGDSVQFSYQQLEDALRSGTSTINTELNLRSAQGHYRLNVSIDISQHLCG